MNGTSDIMRRMRWILAPATAAILLLAACSSAPVDVAVRTRAAGSPTPAPSFPPTNPAAATTLSGDATVQVVRRVAPAVVNVTSRIQAVGSIFGGSGTGKAVGTGFIIRSDGIVVTNFHVVEDASAIKVTLPKPNGRTYLARVIGGDSDHDLAVLKIDGTALPSVPLGDSSKLQLGQTVIALGYALALPGGPTVTEGIISALARTVQAEDPNANNGAGVTRTYQDALQTDAAINPGNSGGPLVDLSGNVVGINTAGNQQAENIGFAIAINAAKGIIDRAIENPSAPTAYLGVTTETVDSGLQSQFGLGTDQGALVVGLSPDGPAQKAGIQVGDVIVGFEGKQVKSSDDLGTDILNKQPGDRVPVQVVRQDGRKATLTVTLGVRPLPVSTSPAP
jgi:serine protease Do